MAEVGRQIPEGIDHNQECEKFAARGVLPY